jgi:hypothetical protein
MSRPSRRGLPEYEQRNTKRTNSRNHTFVSSFRLK